MNTKQAARKMHIGWKTLETLLATHLITPPLNGMWTPKDILRAQKELKVVIQLRNEQSDLKREKRIQQCAAMRTFLSLSGVDVVTLESELEKQDSDLASLQVYIP